MATSITQARPLLTAAELELFSHSRAEPIKLLSAKQLAGKEKRARALRDKYRDLYRRQTLAVRGKAARAGAMGDANARTQRKAEIMEEVLERFESRASMMATRDERASAPRGANRKAASSAAVTKPVSRAAKPAAPAKRSKAAAAAAAAAPAVAAPKSAKKAVAAPSHLTGKDPVSRSSKAPSSRAPTAGGKARGSASKAPIDLVPSALRVNPVKSSPGSLAIQGHVSSNVRRQQGKRDSR
ncbi:MAG: hypothetical protein ABIR55_08330 [Burkholderiaceae bacterium]